MKIQGAIGPKNGVRKAAQKLVALTMASPVRVVMVAAASYFRKAGPHKVMRKRFNNVLGHVCTSAEWDVVAKRDICRPSFWGPPGVVFSVPARFPKTFSASKSLGLHIGMVGCACLPFAWPSR